MLKLLEVKVFLSLEIAEYRGSVMRENRALGLSAGREVIISSEQACQPLPEMERSEWFGISAMHIDTWVRRWPQRSPEASITL